MSYVKQTWADGPSGGTPVNAERLNHIEDGLDALDALVSTVPAATGVAGTDTPRIVAALAAAGAAGGGTVHLQRDPTNAAPAYLLSANVTVPGNVTLDMHGAKITSTANLALLVSLAGANAKIRNGFLDNPNPANCLIVDVAAGATHPTVERISFTGATTQAVNVDKPGIKHVRVKDCTFTDVNYGVLTNSGPGTGAYDLKDVRVTGCTFLAIRGDGVEFNHPSGVAGAAYLASDFIVEGCHLEGNATSGSINSGFGVGVAGAARVKIANNSFVGWAQQAIHVEDKSRDVGITGNTITGGGTRPGSAFPSGIYVMTSEQITVTGNTLHAVQGTGIEIAYDVANENHYSTVTGNLVHNCTLTGISVLASAGPGDSHATITGNTSISNGGDGIRVAGHVLVVAANVADGNTGYGINALAGRLVKIANNITTDNVAGDYAPTANVRLPIINHGGKAMSVAAGAEATSSQAQLLELGAAASGRLFLTVTHPDIGNGYLSKLFDIKWDGTTLTQTLIATPSTSGAIGGGTLSMNGSRLQATAYNGLGVAAVLNFAVEFEGMVIR